MIKECIWQCMDALGLEHLRLTQSADNIIAESVVMGVTSDTPFHTHYRICCDLAWRVLEVDASPLYPGGKAFSLRADGQGHWSNRMGKPIPELNGCLDVDISITPFTNTLPIRRLKLQPVEYEDITVVHIALHTQAIRLVRQRYTCLQSPVGDEQGMYQYQNFSYKYTSYLSVDADGLVCDYPEVYKRVWPD